MKGHVSNHDHAGDTWQHAESCSREEGAGGGEMVAGFPWLEEDLGEY